LSAAIARGAWAAVVSLICSFLAPRAEAQLTSNDYNIDLFTGPVLGASRIIGMGGAHTAIASGIDGASYNPAGYAERVEKEINFFAFDITAGLQLGGLFRNNDIENNGKRSLRGADTIQAGLGMRFQLGHTGIGSSALARIYTVKDATGRSIFDLMLTTVRVGGGYALFGGDVVVGGAMVFTAFDLNPAGTNRTLVGLRGFGAEVGALYRPARQRYRVGATFHSPISSRTRNDASEVGTDGLRRAENLVLPSGVHVPWEIDVGFAYQFGERRSNVPWRNTRELRRELREQIRSGSYVYPPTYGEQRYQVLPDDLEKAVDVAVENYRESERRFRRHQPRRYVLLAADVLFYGKTPNGQSMSAFLLQQPEVSGDKVSFGARVGAESEVMQDRLKVRAGSYLEPSRTKRKYYRPHATLGIEARLFDLWRWSARGTATIDVAPRYFNWGVAFGLWW
jgi:hypothetical protein